MLPVSVVILAAGKGTRMKSDLPKVLHQVANMTMLEHVLNKAVQVSDDIRVITSEELRSHSEYQKLETKFSIKTILQKERLGTANAVSEGLKNADYRDNVLVLYADTPLITLPTLYELFSSHVSSSSQVTVIGFETDNPEGYGRLIEDEGKLIRIVEDKDADLEIKNIRLCNSGMMIIDKNSCQNLLNKIDNNNTAKEYYLTDIIRIICNYSGKCKVVRADSIEAKGVNDLIQLAEVDKLFQQRFKRNLMELGVVLLDPDNLYISADAIIEPGAKVYPNVYIDKETIIKSGATIYPFSHLAGVVVEKGCEIGPFARIRPSTQLSEGVKIGNFVEVKNAQLAAGSKASHLSYIGDAFIGARSNIGAGTIFCNYDGKNKHKSNIEEEVFIGSNSCIISPINIKKNAKIAAGSVITHDVAENELVIARARQVHYQNKGTSDK